MSKSKKSPVGRQQTFPELFDAFITLVEQLENNAGDNTDPFNVASQQLFEHFFADAPKDVRTVYKVLMALDDFCNVETAARNAGFVMGMAYARGLLAPGHVYRGAKGGV
jgi:hypothetical protein